jgi:hypothetical protein
MVLLPDAPVESAPLPYSTQIDPAPSVMESGWLALAPPVAKVETLTVGAAWAEAAAETKIAVVTISLLWYDMTNPPRGRMVHSVSDCSELP